MSAPSFKGTFFKYDVGLVDQSLETQPTAAEPVSNSSAWLTFADKATAIGTVEAVEVLSVQIQGQGMSGDDFVVATSSAAGALLVRARLTYRPSGATESITRVHNFSVPIETSSADVKIGVSESFGKVILDSLPAAGPEDFSPINDATTMLFTLSAVAIANAAVAGAEINDKLVSFPQGFTSAAKTSGAIAVSVNYVSQPTVLPVAPVKLTYVAGSQASHVKSIESFEITGILFNGGVANGTWTLSGATINGHLKGTDGGDAAIDSDVALVGTFADSTTVSVVESGRNVAITVPNSGDLTLTFSSLAPGTNVEFDSAALVLTADSVIPFKHLGSTNYLLDADEVVVFNLSSGNVPIFFKGLNYNEQLHFLDKAKGSIVAAAPAFTLYEQFPAVASGKVLDITSDAGFVIPAVVDGVFQTKYVRISDLYNALANKSESQVEDVPELADRLHALEVALDNACSSTLEGNADSEAVRLFAVKNKWSVLDITPLI